MIKTITFVALLWITLLHTQPVHGTFGNEYVHIKVHLPKEHTPTIVEPEAPHKVIHHYHHKTKARSRAPKKPTGLQSPLLESVILSELDKPSHANEHAEYLNHAKELAEHIAKPVETYVVKKQLPPPKKIVNTYAIIEEKIKPHHEHHVDTFKVIETKLPIHQHQRHNHGYNQDEYEHEQEHEDYDYAYKQTTSHQTHYDDSVDHEYEPAQSHYEPHEHRVTHNRHHLRAAYAEPAPVEEAPESDDEYGYQPQPYQPQLQQQQQQHYYYGRQTKYTNKQPSESLTVPGEDAGIDNYYGASVDTVSGIADAYSYNKRPSYNAGAVLDSFRPSPQVHDAQKSSYDDYSLVDSYLATKRAPTHSASYSRPLASEIEWPAATGYNSAATKTYSGIDSYSAGHGQDIESGNYQYASPYE